MNENGKRDLFRRGYEQVSKIGALKLNRLQPVMLILFQNSIFHLLLSLNEISGMQK